MISDVDEKGDNEEYASALSDTNTSQSDETEFLYVLASMLKPIEDQIMSEEEKSNKEPMEEMESAEESESINKAQDLSEINSSPDPEVMAVANVMEMLQQIREDVKKEIMNARREDIQKLADELKSFKQTCIQETIREVSSKVEGSPKLSKLESEVAFWKFKSDALTDVCQRMQTEIGDLTSRIENLELNNAKKMVLIHGSGITVEGKKFEAGQEIEAMIELSMDIKNLSHRLFHDEQCGGSCIFLTRRKETSPEEQT